MNRLIESAGALIFHGYSLAFHGSHRSDRTLSASHGIKTGSHSFGLTRCAPSGLHSVAMRTMETPSLQRFAPFKAVYWLWRYKLVLYSIRVLNSCWILIQIWYATFLMMKFLGLLIGLQIFTVVLDPLQNQMNQCEVPRYGPVRTMESQRLVHLGLLAPLKPATTTNCGLLKKFQFFSDNLRHFFYLKFYSALGHPI